MNRISNRLKAGVLLAALPLMLTSCGQSVSGWAEEKKQEINQELSQENHPFRQKVQERHLTVTVKEAKVSNVEVKTRYDFAWTGWDCLNVDYITFDIDFSWDGIIHQNGKTVLRIKMLPMSKEILSTEVLHTDASINFGGGAEWKKFQQEIKSLFCDEEAEPPASR